LMMERLHNAVSKNIVIFILAALRTWNLTVKASSRCGAGNDQNAVRSFRLNMKIVLWIAILKRGQSIHSARSGTLLVLGQDTLGYSRSQLLSRVPSVSSSHMLPSIPMANSNIDGTKPEVVDAVSLHSLPSDSAIWLQMFFQFLSWCNSTVRRTS
jgi:hypothetical protein